MKTYCWDVGILTFHCSDNSGAMLQAYGLKHFLRSRGIRAGLIPYAPPYLTGRHWLIPYVPVPGPAGLLKCGAYAAYGLGGHLRHMRSFALRRANMARFRQRQLLAPGQAAIYFPGGLKELGCRCYIAGSDQIWNPDITLGLRPEYFGSFAAGSGARVIAYAASLGGVSLPPRYDPDFARLIRCLDAVSLREREAAAYVRRFYHGEVAAVLDPVFLPDRDAWTAVEEAPARTGYILTVRTEPNPAMEGCAGALSQKTGLPVVALGTPEDASGPAEFLGLIHHADYVVTNSFHATAFSIIYEKKFLAFAHSRRGARIESVLGLHGLEDRLCREAGADINAPIDWPAVRRRNAAAAAESAGFLMRNLPGGL